MAHPPRPLCKRKVRKLIILCFNVNYLDKKLKNVLNVRPTLTPRERERLAAKNLELQAVTVPGIKKQRYTGIGQ